MRILYFIGLILFTYNLPAQHALETYLVKAADNHPRLKARYHEYLAALERVDQNGQLPDPQLSFGYFISPVETRVGPQKFKFSIGQMFPWFGTLEKEKAIHAELAKAKYEAFQDEKRQLYRQIKREYYELSYLQEKGKLIEENISILATLKNLATQRFENNQGTLVEVIQTGISINDLENDFALNNDLLITNKRNFNLLIGEEPGSEIEVAPIDKDESTSPLYQIDEHPKLRNIEFEVSAYEEQMALSKLKGGPKFGLGLDYVVVGERSNVDISDNGQNAFMPMVSMSLPVFRKKYKAATKETELLKRSRQELLANTKLDLTTAYESNLYQLNRARKQLALYDKQVREAQSATDLLLSAYSGNQAKFEELLEMQQLVLKYRIARQAALRDQQVALAELEYFTSKDI